MWNIFCQKSLHFEEPSCLDIGKLLHNHTASHVRSPQDLQHTAVETAWISKEKYQCILGLHPQIPRHFKWLNSERASQNLRQPNIVTWLAATAKTEEYGLMSFPHVSRNTLIYAHMNLRNLKACGISFDWLKLPAHKVGGFVELILIY